MPTAFWLNTSQCIANFLRLTQTTTRVRSANEARRISGKFRQAAEGLAENVPKNGNRAEKENPPQ
jgi:hypothetical protein